MHKPWHDDAIEVADNGLEGLALLWRGRGQLLAHLAWCEFGHYRFFGDRRIVFGQPIDQGVACATEFVGRHVFDWRIYIRVGHGGKSRLERKPGGKERSESELPARHAVMPGQRRSSDVQVSKIAENIFSGTFFHVRCCCLDVNLGNNAIIDNDSESLTARAHAETTCIEFQT